MIARALSVWWIKPRTREEFAELAAAQEERLRGASNQKRTAVPDRMLNE